MYHPLHFLLSPILDIPLFERGMSYSLHCKPECLNIIVYFYTVFSFSFFFRVSPFSRGVIFTRVRVSLALLSLRKNGGLLEVYLGIRILSSRAESIPHSFASLTRERYFQHSKIKFVSPRGHVISFIYTSFFKPQIGRKKVREVT